MVAIDSGARYGGGRHSAWRLLEGDAPARSGAPAEVRSPTRAREKTQIVCAACAHAITTVDARISILDAHEHRFMNLAGLLFHIGCFAEAPGCLVVGIPSDEYPWFPGFSWRLALCAACTAHLGWHFEAGADAAFFGLCLDRVRLIDGSPAD
jgi:hypothetical protein